MQGCGQDGEYDLESLISFFSLFLIADKIEMIAALTKTQRDIGIVGSRALLRYFCRKVFQTRTQQFSDLTGTQRQTGKRKCVRIAVLVM